MLFVTHLVRIIIRHNIPNRVPSKHTADQFSRERGWKSQPSDNYSHKDI